MSSLWALPCPLPRVSNPLRRADALPFPSSPGGITVADLVHEAQSEEAACRGWVMTFLCWCSTCCAGPRDPPTPLGLVGGGEPWLPGLHQSLAHGRGTAVCRGLAGVPVPPPPLRGCQLAALVCLCPPPPGWRLRYWCGGCDTVVVVPPSAGSRPAAAGAAGGGGGWRVGAAAVPSWIGGGKAGEGAEKPLLGSHSGSGVSGGGGGRSSSCDYPSASLAALWRFCWRWALSPPSDARFLPLPGPDRLSRSWATGNGANGAS